MYKIYVIELGDGSYYTGIAKDLKDRFDEHVRGKGSKYVRSRLPIVHLIYSEEAKNRSEAQKREAAIKKMSRKKKEVLGEKFRRDKEREQKRKASKEE